MSTLSDEILVRNLHEATSSVERLVCAAEGENLIECDGVHDQRSKSGASSDHQKGAIASSSEHSILTEDLLERLLASSSLDVFLPDEDIEDCELTGYLSHLLSIHGLKRAAVARESGVNPTFVYDIFAGKSKPGRDRAIMLALGLHCSLGETQGLLRRVGVAELWCKMRRDAIIMWCINEGFSRVQTDDELARLGERTLLSSDRLH